MEKYAFLDPEAVGVRTAKSRIEEVKPDGVLAPRRDGKEVRKG